MSKTMLLRIWKDVPAPVIGMLHLLPLPGAPQYGGDQRTIERRLLEDAEALVEGGVHGLMLENFGDAPFYPDRVPAHVVAQMTHLAGEVRRRFNLPLGINVLRNDGRSGLAIAHAVGAAYIRVNVLCGARVTDQGVLQGIAHELLRDRILFKAADIRIWADVNVKHATPLGQPRPLEDEIEDTLARGMADAVVVSGSATGKATAVDEVRRAKAAAGNMPVIVGSGVTPESIHSYLPWAGGFIVGTGVKIGGVPDAPVDAERVRRLMGALAR